MCAVHSSISPHTFKSLCYAGNKQNSSRQDRRSQPLRAIEADCQRMRSWATPLLCALLLFSSRQIKNHKVNVLSQSAHWISVAWIWCSYALVIKLKHFKTHTCLFQVQDPFQMRRGFPPLIIALDSWVTGICIKYYLTIVL